MHNILGQKVIFNIVVLYINCPFLCSPQDLLCRLISRRHRLLVDMATVLGIGPHTMCVKVMEGPLPEERLDLGWSAMPNMLTMTHVD